MTTVVKINCGALILQMAKNRAAPALLPERFAGTPTIEVSFIAPAPSVPEGETKPNANTILSSRQIAFIIHMFYLALPFPKERVQSPSLSGKDLGGAVFLFNLVPVSSIAHYPKG